jgi:hypothetical protein
MNLDLDVVDRLLEMIRRMSIAVVDVEGVQKRKIDLLVYDLFPYSQDCSIYDLKINIEKS